jgi:aspartyl protease family protein
VVECQLPKLDVAGSTPVARSSAPAMGLTVLKVEVANPAKPKVAEAVDFLIDSGAIYSVVPAPILRRLGIRPLRKREEFRLADGSTIERRKGVALFRYQDKEGGADVVFGEPGDSNLLGALTLEALGLSLDPLRRELRPLPMILAGWKPEHTPKRGRR